MSTTETAPTTVAPMPACARGAGQKPGYPRGYVPGPLHGLTRVYGPGGGFVMVTTCDGRGR